MLIFSYANAQFDSVQVSHRYSYSDGNGLPYGLRSRTELHFDSAGHIISNRYETWDSVQFTPSYLTKFSFNSSGNETESLRQNWNGQQWENSTVTWTFWNSFQSIDSLIEASSLNDTSWQITSIIRNGYDALNHLVYYKPYSSNRYFYFPDINGNDTLELHETYNGVSWSGADSTINLFDGNNNNILSMQYQYYSSMWHLMDSIITLYYPNDSILSSRKYSFGSGSAVLTRIDSIVYIGDTTYTYYGNDSIGFIVYHARNIHYDDGSGYNYYHSNDEYVSGIWDPLDHEHCVYDSLTNTAHESSVVAGSQSSSDYTFDLNNHLLNSSWDGTTHSGNYSYGNNFYYYYLTKGPTGICPNDADTISVLAGMNSYLWNNNDTLNTTIVTQAGDYYCDIINQWGFPYRSEPHFMIAATNPSVNLGNDTVVCINSPLLIYPGHFDFYSWNNGSNDSAIILQSFVADTQQVSIIVTNSYGCTGGDSLGVRFDLCSGLQNIGKLKPYLYPNPSSTHSTVFLNGNKYWAIELYDNLGQKLFFKSIDNENQIEIDLSLFKNGSYWVVLKNDVKQIFILAEKISN